MATAGLISQYQITTFVSPVNGTSPIDANTVRGNDNTIKSAYDLHDADGTIHLQSSTLAARDTFGTVGRKWLTSDGLRVYYDTGAAWSEVAYLPTVGGAMTGTVTVTLGTVTVSTPAFSSTATWNDGAVTFVHQFVNVTATASAAASLLADWQVGAVSQWKVSKAGLVTQTGGLAIGSGHLSIVSAVTTGSNANDPILGNAIAWRASNAAASTTYHLLSLTAGDIVSLDGSKRGVAIGGIATTGMTAGVIGIANSTGPTQAPVAGGFLYVDSGTGALTFYGSGSTVTVLAPA